MPGVNLSDYVTVAQRIAQFRERYPSGCLRPVNPDDPFKVVTIGDKTYITYAAAAYRTPDDTLPGVGVAWEPFPGKTPYTRDSELMNAETSAWGRAIVAVLAGDTNIGIATQEDVRNRQQAEVVDPQKFVTDAMAVTTRDELTKVYKLAGQAGVLQEKVADASGEKMTLTQFFSKRGEEINLSKSSGATEANPRSAKGDK